MRIAVFGAGYAGLVTGAGLARSGHRVIVTDTSSDRLENLRASRAPFHEPGLEDLLREGFRSGGLDATADPVEALDDSDLSLVAVGTPSLPDGDIDLTHVLSVCRTIGAWLPKSSLRHTVVVKSTVVPGSTEGPIRAALEAASGLRAGTDFGLGMNPEFLREGFAVEDFLHPDRIVLGAYDEGAAAALRELYSSFDCPKIETTPVNAEAIKYASNSLLATLVSFSNEWAAICEDLPGADATTVMEALHLDRRLSFDGRGQRIRPGIVSYLIAGPGFGGSCLPKDLSAARAAARKRGVPTPLLDGAARVNEDRPGRVMAILRRELDGLSGRIVAVLGLSFKPGTDDVRDSPALPLIRLLEAEGATCRVWDPMAAEHAAAGRRFGAEEALNGADAALVVTAWPEIAQWPWEDFLARMRRRVIVDSRGLLRSHRWPENVRYVAIGRGQQAGPPQRHKTAGG